MINKIRYVIKEVRKNGHNRDWWRGRINTYINSPTQKQFRPPSEAVDIPNSDWDILILLDAMREDLYSERTVELSHDFEEKTVRSKASATREWLDQNFTDEYGDIVYVAGNPQVSKYKPNRFHQLVEVWRDGYDAETDTIPAEEVTDSAIEARKEFPNKRLIVHYAQPHEPFVDNPELNFFKWDETFPSGSGMTRTTGDAETFHGSSFRAIHYGVATQSEVWTAYRDNLDYVLKEVNRLINHLNGRVVITSDHGNTFPRFSWPIPVRVWGHPPGLRHRELIIVPWLEATLSSRPEIVDGGVNPPAEYNEAELERTLASLGYQ